MTHRILSLSSLPEDVLVEIFEYLPGWSLIELTKCSKFLNNLIGSNKYLLKKIEVLLTENKKKNCWIGSRKYSKVKLSKCQLSTFYSIFVDIGESIKELTLNDCQVNANYFKQILNHRCYFIII